MKSHFSPLISLLILCACSHHTPALQAPGVENCYAVMTGDTLRVGNSFIERSFVWTSGGLKTISLDNRTTGAHFVNLSGKPDFALTGNDPAATGLNFTVDSVAATPIRGARLEACVEYTCGELQIRRVYAVGPTSPAISVSTYLKGVCPTDADCRLDQLNFQGRHWRMKAVEFRDVTDENNDLVFEKDVISYKNQKLAGNLLFVSDAIGGEGYFFLKESPCNGMQIGYPGFDFDVTYGHVQVKGAGFCPEDICSDFWTRCYSCVTGVSGTTELSALTALRKYRKAQRTHLPERDEMIMMNTWGDRSQDVKVTEAFCLNELELGARLGITHFQIDDGWQNGRSPASKFKAGSFDNIWKVDDYWIPDPEKYPDGLGTVMEKAAELGINVGLWFNPCNTDDLADWEKDADVILSLYRRYGIRYFKIDGLQITSKKAEENLSRLFDKVKTETSFEVVINLDVTAGRRVGYFFMGDYGNIFLENRYTDWGNYYPYKTLRNLWSLSRYVPTENLQIEFLNNSRNADKYPAGDIFAPANYDFGYLFAITMAAQPLAWFEASGLPEQAFGIAPIVSSYKEIMADIHNGIILPIGNEPDGVSWTGFQSICSNDSGYIIIYREYSEDSSALVETWLPKGIRVELTPVIGDVHRHCYRTGDNGALRFSISSPNSFAVWRYKCLT